MSKGKLLITGCGAITSIGSNINETWDSIIQKKSGVDNISSFNPENFSCRIAAEIKQLEIDSILNKKEVKRYSRSAQLALIAATEAIENSAILNYLIDSTRVGVFWASGNGGVASLDKALIEYGTSNSKHAFNPFLQSNVLNDSAGSRISSRFGFRGPNMTIVSACSSGNVAFQVAALYLKSGVIDYAIVGGCEAPITPSVIGGFSAMNALSTNNDNPTDACVPFSEARDGFIVGEGAAAVVLEYEKSAASRNINPYAYFIGAAQNNEAGHITSPTKDGYDAAECINKALQNSELESHEIDVISAHGTGTIAGDTSEYYAYKKVFGENLKRIPITITKSLTGHLLGASSSLEAVLCIEMLKRQTLLPGKTKYPLDKEFLNPELFIPEVQVQTKLNFALNHSSGFGGQNATTIFQSL